MKPQHVTLNRAGSILVLDKWDLSLLQFSRNFLSEVQSTFTNKPGIYDAFLHLLTSFKAKSIDAAELARRTYELFEGNHDLVVRFDQFISNDCVEEAKRKRADNGPFEELGQILEKPREYVEVQNTQNTESPKVVAVAFSEVSKERNLETPGCTLGTVDERGDDITQSCQVDKFYSRQPSEGISTEGPGTISLETAADAVKKRSKKMQHSNLPNGEYTESSRSHTRQQKIQVNVDDRNREARDENITELIGKSQDCVREGFHDSQAQCYQRRLRKGRDGNMVLALPSQNRGKNCCKSVSDLDLSRSVTCTPSYRLLPMKYMRTSSQLHPLRAEVLNDHWVCVPSGNQSCCLKHTERNPYEEKLQQCEDERCELDVLLECIRAAIRRIEELLIRLGSGGELCLDDHLTVSDWQCCECLYGELGLAGKDMIQKDPSTALPVVLDRLKQKQDELLSAREHLDKCWKEMYSDNYKNSFNNDSVLTTNDAKSKAKKGSVTQQRQERRSLARKRREIFN